MALFENYKIYHFIKKKLFFAVLFFEVSQTLKTRLQQSVYYKNASSRRLIFVKILQIEQHMLNLQKRKIIMVNKSTWWAFILDTFYINKVFVIRLIT